MENASTPATYWIAEMQLDPPQLIVCDDATSNLYRVPLTINGSDITFGDPVEVQRVFTDIPAPAKTAASGRPARGTAQPVSAAEAPEDADYRRLFGGSPVQVQAARDVSAARAPAARPRRETEARIAAAIAGGKIPRSRAPFYRQLAAEGDDLARLDMLAGGTIPAGAAEDPEDDVYKALYGARKPEPASPEYEAVFPTSDAARAAFDTRQAAKRKAVAALSDDELWDEMGFDRGGSK